MPDTDDTDSALSVEERHRGRMFRVDLSPNGSACISRDGVWLTNAHWSGRTLDMGSNTLVDDLDASDAIVESLVAAIHAALAARPGHQLDPRKKGAKP